MSSDSQAQFLFLLWFLANCWVLGCVVRNYSDVEWRLWRIHVLFIGAWARTRTLFYICSVCKISPLPPLVCIHMCSMSHSSVSYLLLWQTIPHNTHWHRTYYCTHTHTHKHTHTHTHARTRKHTHTHIHTHTPTPCSQFETHIVSPGLAGTHNTYIYTHNFPGSLFSLSLSLSFSLSLAMPIQICNGSLGLAAHTIPIFTHILSLSLSFSLSHTFSLSLLQSQSKCATTHKKWREH